MVQATLSGWRRWRRPALITAAVLAVLLAIAIAAANAVVAGYGRYSSADLASVPAAHAALVLGTSRRLADGRDNLFYRHRIAAAVELWRAGKVRRLVVSGDNRRADYNEPEDMRGDLIAAGVPAEAIVCDYAGRRTLDSVLRFRAIFGQEGGIVVSQRFHNQRAIYLARSHGIALHGYEARDVDAYSGFRTRLRELLSKTVAVLDVVFGTAAAVLGERIPI